MGRSTEAFLSGGLDSSSIAALHKKALVNNEDYNVSPLKSLTTILIKGLLKTCYALKVAEHLDLDLHS